MAFQPRVLGTVLNDILAYIASQTDMTTEVGSFVRSMCEALAIELDDANYQMVLLLDGYSIATASGGELDRRAQDYDMVRLQSEPATVSVQLTDLNLISDTLLLEEVAGSATIELTSTARFPTAGYPYTIRIGEGTLQVEDRSVTNNNTGTNTLTLAVGVVNAHVAGERVSRVTGAADVTVAAGVQVQVPQNGTDPAVVFVTQEAATIGNGDRASQPVIARAQIAGSGGNVGVGRVTQFTSSAPFTGAGVTNPSRGGGGRDLETDQRFRDRILERLRSLSTGNISALKQAAIGVADETTGQRVVTANVLEDFAANEVRVLIDDGTGFDPNRVTPARAAFAVADPGGSATIRVLDASLFPAEGWLILSPENGAQIELVEYVSLNYATGTFVLSGVTANAHDVGDEVLLVETVDLNSEAGRNYWRLSQYGIIRNSDRVFLDEGGGWIELAEGTDYDLNRGTGDLQKIGAGAALGSRLVVAYGYYTGLVQLVQRVLNGDDSDPETFPGVRAAGVEVIVETPTIRRIRVRASIAGMPGFEEEPLRLLAQEAIETYVSGLGIGEDVIRAEIIAAAMNVPGVYNAVVSEPSDDVAILEDQLPLPTSTSGTSLVVVV